MKNTSYVIGSGSQEEDLGLVKYIAVGLLSVIIVLTIFGNVLVLYAFCHFRKLRKPAHFFIASLALSDLLVGMVTIPMWMSFELTRWRYLPEWMDVLVMVHVWTCIDIICSAASISNLLFIAIDRCIAVTFPLWHRHHVTRRIVCRTIALAWLYAVIPAVVYLQDWKWKYILILIIAFAIPLVFIITCYLYIIIIAKRKKRRLQSDFKTAKTFGIVTGTFVVTWMPFFVCSIVIQYCGLSCGHFSREIIDNVTSMGKALHYSNSCLNPVIYAYHSQPFKAAFIALVRKWTSRDSDMRNAPSISSYRSFRSRFNSVDRTVEHFQKRRHSENTCTLEPERLRLCSRFTSTQVILNNCKSAGDAKCSHKSSNALRETEPHFRRHSEINSLSCNNETKNIEKKLLRARYDGNSQVKHNVKSEKKEEEIRSRSDSNRETSV